MSYVSRPTIGNTSAIGRFSPDGPIGYVAVYQDGTHGPIRSTRAEAEADYREQTACPWLPHRTEDLPEDVAYAACRNFYKW